jgi:hypothetical protein
MEWFNVRFVKVKSGVLLPFPSTLLFFLSPEMDTTRFGRGRHRFFTTCAVVEADALGWSIDVR